MPCSGSQHQTAYGSPAELSERTLSMRTAVKSKSKRKESRKQWVGMMHSWTEMSLRWLPAATDALLMAFWRSAMSFGCFALWALNAAAAVTELSWIRDAAILAPKCKTLRNVCKRNGATRAGGWAATRETVPSAGLSYGVIYPLLELTSFQLDVPRFDGVLRSGMLAQRRASKLGGTSSPWITVTGTLPDRGRRTLRSIF